MNNRIVTGSRSLRILVLEYTYGTISGSPDGCMLDGQAFLAVSFSHLMRFWRFSCLGS